MSHSFRAILLSMAMETFSAPQTAHFDPLPSAYATADGITDRLRLAIDLGDLRDGQKLPREAELASQLGVSIFALREALGRLRKEGLVSTRAGRGGGTVVTSANREVIADIQAREQLVSMSAVSLRDLADWRSMLVGDVAELAANRASVGNMRRGSRYIELMRKAEHTSKFTWAENKWLIELSLASQSLRLNAAIIDVQRESGMLSLFINREAVNRENSVAAIEKIQQAIEARDALQARGLAKTYSLLRINVLVRARLRLISEASDD